MGFLLLLANPVVAGLMKFAIGSAVAYFATKPIIERWGSTPANRAEQAGVSKAQLYEDAKKRREDKKNYYKEKNKEVLEELSELKKKLEKLEKQKANQAKEISEESDPTEKAKKIVAMKETEKEMKKLTKEIKEYENQIANNNKELEKVFDDIGNLSNLTEEQFVARSNSPDLGAWKNWGIIAICVIIAILTVKFIFSLFRKLTQGIE